MPAEHAATANLPQQDLSTAFQVDRQFLWGLCYRMVGNAADADDLIQETFVRAMERPPSDCQRPWRPWLVRVTMNLARDHLRRRRRRTYSGTWLPGPIATEDEGGGCERGTDGRRTTEGRYELLESVTFAFLLALEALTPQQRAVLILRDVFDQSGDETAQALGISQSNVKTTLHRARAAMSSYDRARRRPSRELQDATRAVLHRFLQGLASRDLGAVEALLAEEVRAVSDGGEFSAAQRTVVGRTRVGRLLVGLHGKPVPVHSVSIRSLNGLPALLIETVPDAPRQAPRVVIRCDLDTAGKVAEIHFILAGRKLAGLERDQSASSFS